jgi:dGTPase
MPVPSTLEAQVARLSDRVAYVNHDIDDAMRAGILTEDDIPAIVRELLGATHAERIDTLVADAVHFSEDRPEIGLSREVGEALDALREFMFERVYLRTGAAEEQDKAIGLLRSLFAHYVDHPEEIPAEYHLAPGDTTTRVADYIAGMTDRYALRMYEQIFLPQGWLL